MLLEHVHSTNIFQWFCCIASCLRRTLEVHGCVGAGVWFLCKGWLGFEVWVCLFAFRCPCFAFLHFASRFLLAWRTGPKSPVAHCTRTSSNSPASSSAQPTANTPSDFMSLWGSARMLPRSCLRRGVKFSSDRGRRCTRASRHAELAF